MGSLAVIGGSGFASMPELEVLETREAKTRFGTASSSLVRGRIHGHEVFFLPRHGDGHRLPPHRINYRANIRALADAGVDRIIALAAVGGITGDYPPCSLCVPDDLVDYTHGREATFFDGDDAGVEHVDFTHPFSPALRAALLSAASAAGLAVRDGAVYGVTQGPRLESAAEIRRLERDGCDLVGMTAMPEAALARELGLGYATLAFVVNWAAGKSAGEIGMDEIEANLTRCRGDVQQLLVALVQSLSTA